MRNSPAFAIACGALAFGVSACGDSGSSTANSGASPATSTTTAATPTSPASPAATATNQARPANQGAPTVDPANFTTKIDNPFFPLAPGSKWVYEQDTSDGLERIVVRVTDQTREIMGVSTVVVQDTVTLEGEVIEDTFDWYAQDKQGNVWYFGEDTREFENGVAVNRKGSFEAGIDGAAPGIVMKANPQVGDAYDQELAPGVAEDAATVLSISGSTTVPLGTYTDVLRTEDINRLEPGQVENKFYARGIGNILNEKVEGDNVGEKGELVAFTR